MSTEEQNKNIPVVDEVTKVKYVGGDEYDGIRELDNRLPPWLKYVFYITIVFSAAYLVALFIFENDELIQDKEYAKEVAKAEAEIAAANIVTIDENTIKIVTDEASLADGKSTYDKICLVCHAKFGEGLVGPNFTDQYYIHGGTIIDMYKIVISGVIEKGMISYKDQLSGTQIQNVLSYIISLEGTNPPNQKAAEGELWERPVIAAAASVATEEPVVSDSTEVAAVDSVQAEASAEQE